MLRLAVSFAGLLALSVYGFWSRRLWEQELWQPPGGERFLIFLAVMLVWAGAWILARPAWFAPATWVAASFYAIHAVGSFAPVATGLFLFASFVLGRAILRDRLPGLLALLTGMSVLLWVTSVLAHFPVNYPATYLALFAACLLVTPRITAACAHELARLLLPRPATRGESVMLAVACLPILAHGLIALKPEVSADALSMHLVVPAYVSHHHQWSFDFQQYLWAVMPMGGVWGYTATYLIGGEFAARLLNFALLVITCALVFQCALRWVGRSTALLLVALFAATPVVQLVTGSLFVESFYAVLLMGALTALLEGSLWALLVCAFLLASAMGVKLTALPFVAVVAAALSIRLAGSYSPRVLAFLAAMAILAAQPYGYAWWKTGNPAFPYLNSIFRSPHFTAVYSPDYRFAEPLTWRLPFDLTFETNRYWEGQAGSAGFHLLLMAPLIVLCIRRTWKAAEWTVAGVALLGAGAALVTKPNVRYLYPAFPLLTCSLALLFADLQGRTRTLVWTGATAALALNLWFLPSSSWYHKAFCLNPFDRDAATKYLEQHAPARLLVARLNQSHPGESVLFLETMDIAGLRGTAYSDGWHCHSFIGHLRSLGTHEDVLDFLKRRGVRHFVYPRPDAAPPVSDSRLRRILTDYAEKVEDRGNLRLATLRLRPANPAEEPPAGTGRYDDFDPHIRFHAFWSHNPQFRETANHSVTYSDVPGATFRFRFRGTEIEWVYTKASNRGVAEVFIDGQSRARVDLHSAETEWQARHKFGGLAEGEHLLEVKVLGKRHPQSSGGFVDVDELVVR